MLEGLLISRGVLGLVDRIFILRPLGLNTRAAQSVYTLIVDDTLLT
jgi:hypothetical protein